MISEKDTNERIEEFRGNLDRVINEMALSKSDVERIIRKAVKKVISVSEPYRNLGSNFSFDYSEALDEMIDNILSDTEYELLEFILDRTMNISHLASSESKDNRINGILAYLSQKIAGESAEDTVIKYTKMLKYEIEAYTAIGFDGKLEAYKIEDLFMGNIYAPYKSREIQDAFSNSSFKARNIRSKGLTIGRGKVNSSINGLYPFQKSSIFGAYNKLLQDEWSKSGIFGWFTIRGGTIPCNLCDDMVGMFHPITEPYRGYHSNCCCLMIPVYSDEA